MSVGNINLRFHVGPCAPVDARIRDTGIAIHVLRHAMQGDRVTRLCARRATRDGFALLRSVCDRIVHIGLTVLFTLSQYNRSMRLVLGREILWIDVPLGSVHGCVATPMSG